MKPVKQKICSKEIGDCFRACIASILEVENDDNLPNNHERGWAAYWMKFFRGIGLRLNYDRDKIWREGYWIASVPSKNFSDVYHAIVMCGDKVAFDPSTAKRYKTGRNLLGKKLVNFGYWIEVSDIGLFKKWLSKKI